MNKVRLIKSESGELFQQEVNEFLEEISSGQVVSVQYATTPTAITTHTEFGVYSSIEYSALIHYRE
ncbi:hypothetical protein A0U40_17640 [[Bacillus] sp. KCTC 13219]|nr:hypothetical protein A0U40_17640 [[Bacillus] sp. KCTC 13219]